MSELKKNKIFFPVLFLAGYVFFSNAIFSDDDLKFAEKLIGKGYQSLGAKYFEKALTGKISDSKKDDIYLSLFQIYNKMATASSDEKVKAAYEKKANEYFSLIKNGDKPEVQLERVKVSMTTMKSAQFKLSHPIDKPTPEEAKQLKAETVKAFDLVAKVSDKVRLDSRSWLNKYEQEMEEKEQKKNEKEYQRQRQLEIEASLMFGEACVILANSVGHKDKNAREWLLRMAKNYEEFISNNFGELPSVIGNIYLGEVFILLEKFKDDYGDVDGVKRGIETFDDALAGLEGFENDSRIKDFITNWIITAHSKKATSLMTVGKNEEAVNAYDELFKWAKPDRFKPSESNFHDLTMYNLSQFCKLLLQLYNDGDKSKVNFLANYALAGFNFTKKTNSRWHINFADIMGKLPADDPNIVETTDIAFLKAGQLFNKAVGASEKAQEDLYIKTAMKYKKAINLSRLDGPKKIDEIFPEAAYRMGVCFAKVNNHLLALITFLEAVESYPSAKYPEETHPEIYRNIRGCAVNARASAAARNKISDQDPFDQSLYEKTLKLIALHFPEEGGDPEYFLGDLKRRANDYSAAIKEYAKIPTTSKMYYKAQYYMVESRYWAMKEKVEKQLLKDEALKKEKAELIQEYEKMIELCSKPTDKKAINDDKIYQYIVESKDFVVQRSNARLAALSYEEGDFKTAHFIYAKSLKAAQANSDRHDALTDMITCSFKLNDRETLASEIEQLVALKVGPNYPEGIKNKTLSNAYKMLGNLVIQQKMNPLIASKNKAKGKEEIEQVDTQLKQVYKEVGDVFFSSIKVSAEKDENFLKQIIVFYFSSEIALEKVLEAINLYFEWYPTLPDLESKFRDMLGKDSEAWDVLLGGVMATINIDLVKKTYANFLDSLFDKTDYSEKTIKEIRDIKSDTADQPRNYNTAESILNELKSLADKDRNFQKEGWPKLKMLEEAIKNGQSYYNMLYMQADCFSRLNQYEKASEVYRKLAKYYVEQYDIRIELGKAMFAQENEEGYKKANEVFTELSIAVAKPGASTYNPKDYFNLQFWSTRSKIKALGEKPAANDIVEIWKYFRSYIYQDLGYFAKDEARFNALKIGPLDKGSHLQLIDQIKAWVEEHVFPALKKDGGPLASDSWKIILGEE